MNLVILDYGMGNLKSLGSALKYLNVENVVISNDHKTIKEADKLLLPGVGSFVNAMNKIKDLSLDKILDQVVLKDKKPILGICLGMQLLCDKTEEGETNGLGIVPTKVIRFPNTVKVPQMGWNVVTHSNTGLFQGIEQGCYMYLVHSYFVPIEPETSAKSNYAGEYSVGIKKNNFYGVQFHPEKSSKAGSQLLENFLKI